MAEIPYDEETTRDWSWYAVDEDGFVAQFATGTFRRLPASVRADWECAEELITYFEGATEIGSAIIRPEFETSQIVLDDPRSFEDNNRRLRYLSSFSEASRKGVFTYDTVLRVPGDYFGVTSPLKPLKVGMLSAEMQERLMRTRASIRFSQSYFVPELMTLAW